MTTQTLPHSATAPNTSAPLSKRIGRTAYRLLERMSEAAYRQHAPRLRNHYYL
ncbi:hypothetical protein [Billgrantia sp. C5P2]|uniref:hypothetical protein n=1 Tax=Billgrantia sp. C5P2 TaxID=3436239 RepID=UPI003DA49CAE